MAKRFRDTGIWDEDWYMSLSGNYMLFWDYICDKCDYAGILRPNKVVFEKLTMFNINLTEFLGYVNGDKERILVLPNGRWFLTGFIVFQYFKKEPCVLSMSNHFHRSIIEQLEKNEVPYKSNCYGFEVKEGAQVGAHLPPKDKDKDKDNKKEDKSMREGTEKYLDNVHLMKSEHEKLLSELGPVFLARCIEKLDSYIENNSKGKKYKNHYKAMTMWVINSVKEEGLKPTPYNAQEQALNTESKARVDKAYQEAMEEVARRKRELAGEMLGPIDLRSLCNGIGKDVI